MRGDACRMAPLIRRFAAPSPRVAGRRAFPFPFPSPAPSPSLTSTTTNASVPPAGARCSPSRRGGSGKQMATLPRSDDALASAWGPHLNRMEGASADTGAVPDKLVATHCCFCGQQCGINLKVKDNLVIGFEPRYDFPFNKGMLCPKGVKRYLQGGHPDRLTTALRPDPGAESGFSPMPYA